MATEFMLNTATGWGVEVWGGGWEPIVDGFATEEQADAFLNFLSSHRVDGNTGLRVICYTPDEDDEDDEDSEDVDG